MALVTMDEIIEALRMGETQDWEFKLGKGGLPRDFWETYSAMANTEGGVVILGARQNEDGSITLDGLSTDQLGRLQKQLWDGLHNKATVSVNLLSLKDVEVMTCSGADLLVVRISKASRSQKPVYLGPNPFSHTFRRRHEGDYRCADDEIRRMLADADPLPADHRILHGFTIGDLDQPSINQYRHRFSAATGGNHPWLTLEIKELLEKLGGWRQDRTTGEEGLTVAGLLMFGKHGAILDPEAIPNYLVDYREKLDPKTRWTDRLYPDGTWEANLFQFYQRIWPRLAADLKVPFSLEGWMRKDETPVHEALREALVNALIHTDYAAPGGIVIERYPDRFVLENPGTLLVSLEQLRLGGVSECRNKSLQQMFLMIGSGERAGSGFDKIQSGWRSQHWRVPRLITRFQPDRVLLELPMISLIPVDTLAALQELYGDRFRELSQDEVQALVTVSLEREVSNARLQELLTAHPVDITKMLQGLCQRGFLSSDNRRRWTRYRLAARESADVSSEGVFKSLAGDSPHYGQDSPRCAGHSPHNEVIPSAIDLQALENTAASVSGHKRVPEAEMRAMVLRLCQDRFLTIEQLARILRRNPHGLQERIVKPILKEGLLRMRYPQSPNRPDQAYTANGDGFDR